jgi:hypothetical protein
MTPSCSAELWSEYFQQRPLGVKLRRVKLLARGPFWRAAFGCWVVCFGALDTNTSFFSIHCIRPFLDFRVLAESSYRVRLTWKPFFSDGWLIPPLAL